MKSKKSKGTRLVDAFMSHSSTDSRSVRGLVESLRKNGLSVWVDESDVHFGDLLRNELQAAIKKSRTLVLVWSMAASESRWVMSEILMAFHLDRFIIPCVLDDIPLPQFLQNAAYLSRSRDKRQMAEKLCRTIREAPRQRNEIPVNMAARGPELQNIIDTIAGAQQQEMDALGRRDFDQAGKIHAALDEAMKKFEPAFRMEPMILNLAGYHRKNSYMLKHWDAIQACRAPKDPLLEVAERFFFETLCVNPLDPSALNGLGSILMFERELDAAEFFQRRAIAIAKSEGRDYPAAQHDLDLILYFKKAAKGGAALKAIAG